LVPDVTGLYFAYQPTADGQRFLALVAVSDEAPAPITDAEGAATTFEVIQLHRAAWRLWDFRRSR